MTDRGTGTPASGSPVGRTLGVDIGGTKILGVVIDATGQLVAEARVPTPQPHDPQPDVPQSDVPGAAVADAVGQVVAQLDPAGGSAGPAPVGVGVPGMLDHRGFLVASPNLLGAVGSRMADLLAARMPGRTLMVVNDANCAALAESTSGSATGIADVLLVTLGTGIGGGLVADSRVLVGARGFAGEIGHQVVDPSGPRCPCGRRGCWERYASGAGLVHLARRAARAGALGRLVAHTGGDPEAVRGEDVTAAARAGDPQALVVMDELAWWVALGLANLVAVLDPSTIVLGGGLVEFADLWLGPTKEAFTDMVEGGPDRPHIEIVAAAWGERAGAVGAALAVRRGWR